MGRVCCKAGMQIGKDVVFIRIQIICGRRRSEKGRQEQAGKKEEKENQQKYLTAKIR